MKSAHFERGYIFQFSQEWKGQLLYFHKKDLKKEIIGTSYLSQEPRLCDQDVWNQPLPEKAPLPEYCHF